MARRKRLLDFVSEISSYKYRLLDSKAPVAFDRLQLHSQIVDLEPSTPPDAQETGRPQKHRSLNSQNRVLGLVLRKYYY